MVCRIRLYHVQHPFAPYTLAVNEGFGECSVWQFYGSRVIVVLVPYTLCLPK